MARPHTTAGAPQELGLQDDVASPLLSPTSQNDGSGHSSPCVVSETTVARSCGPTHKSPVRGPAFNSAYFFFLTACVVTCISSPHPVQRPPPAQSRKSSSCPCARIQQEGSSRGTSKGPRSQQMPNSRPSRILVSFPSYFTPVVACMCDLQD